MTQLELKLIQLEDKVGKDRLARPDTGTSVCLLHFRSKIFQIERLDKER